MKKFIALILVLALITIFIDHNNNAQAAADIEYNLKVVVNEKEVNFPDQKPFVDNRVGRTFVPLRFVSEALGCQVDWDNETQTATAQREGTYIEMKIGLVTPVVNSEIKTLDAPARVVNQRTMVPLRFVSEALGEYVDWDGKTRTVYIGDVLREATEPVDDNDSGGNDDDGFGYRPIDGGGGTDTTPVDDTPWTPWDN